jgi:hypothetical protein
MSKSTRTLLKREDYIELRYQVIVKNTTTKTEVRATPDAQITIGELRDNGVVMRLPNGACTTGHMLLVQFIPRTNENPGHAKAHGHPAPASFGKVVPLRKTHEQIAKEKELAQREILALAVEVTAKVKLVQHNDDGTLLVELLFYQFNEKKWREFMTKFHDRQDHIHRIVRKVKE